VQSFFRQNVQGQARSGAALPAPSCVCPACTETKRGSSPLVYRMRTKQRLSEANCVTGDRAWEGRLGESRRPMNKNHIRGRRGVASWHNTAKPYHSAPEVNVAVRWRRFPCLPGEACPALRRAMAWSAQRRDASGDRAGVSRGHITEIENRGAVIRPPKLGNPPARSYAFGSGTFGLQA
jgi:hypothetical protein